MVSCRLPWNDESEQSYGRGRQGLEKQVYQVGERGLSGCGGAAIQTATTSWLPARFGLNFLRIFLLPRIYDTVVKGSSQGFGQGLDDSSHVASGEVAFLQLAVCQPFFGDGKDHFTEVLRCGLLKGPRSNLHRVSDHQDGCFDTLRLRTRVAKILLSYGKRRLCFGSLE